MANREVVYSTCKSCHGGCGVKVTKEDGVIVKIEGNYDSLTNGTMCSKGLSSIQHIDNPYRIKYPMKQAGKKGEGKWKRISWDEALETIAAKMRDARENYGGHTIAVSQGTGRGYNRYTMRMARSLGSGNAITPGYVCHSPRLGPLRTGDGLRPAVLRLPRLGRRVSQDPDHVGQAARDQQRRLRDVLLVHALPRLRQEPHHHRPARQRVCHPRHSVDPASSGHRLRPGLWA